MFGCGEKGSQYHWWWGVDNGSQYKRVLRQPNIDLPSDPVILLLGIYQNEVKIAFEQMTYNPILIIIIQNCEDMETNQMLNERRMDKETVVPLLHELPHSP